MKHNNSGGVLALALSIFLGPACVLQAQAPHEELAKNAVQKTDELKFVVIVSRHGVRSRIRACAAHIAK